MAIAATAATITIPDLFDGNPIVTTSTDLTGVQTVLTFERAVISGLLPAGVQVPLSTLVMRDLNITELRSCWLSLLEDLQRMG
jgi:hypothetical protein